METAARFIAGVRFGFRVVLASATFALVGCDVAQVGSPDIAQNVGSKSEIPAYSGPSHEIRISVDPDGKVVHLEGVRIRTLQKGNSLRTVPTVGKKLGQAPAGLAQKVDQALSKQNSIQVAYFEVPKGKYGGKRAQLRITKMDEYPTDWTPETHPFSGSDHEAYVDNAINEVTSLIDSYLTAYADPEGAAMMRAPADSQYAALAEVQFGLGLNGSGVGGLGTTQSLEEGPCGNKWGLFGAATAAAVAVGITGTAAIAAAAAPVATVIGGITIMVLPTAGTVIAAHAGAILGAVSAGAVMGYSFGDLVDCLRGH